MKKALVVATLGCTFLSGMLCAQKVHDWHDLDAVHKHVIESINEMDRARAANHFDMDGHGQRAQALLQQAEKELQMAIESARTH